MFKSIAFATSLLLATAALAEQSPQSLQALHARVPAPPTSVAAAPAWLSSPELTSLRQQLKDQRAFIEKLSTQAGSDALPSAGQTGGIDFQRAARDPAYAQQLQAKIASMSQEEQMKLAMQMSQAQSQSAIRDVKAMAADPESVSNAVDHYPDYQAKQMAGGITAQYAAVDKIRHDVNARVAQISAKASKALKCSDGEGGCPSAAAEAEDKATLEAAEKQIVAEYDRALVAIGVQVEAARKARAADIAAAQRDLAPAQYGAAAKSSTNRQLLGQYHNTVLNEIEQLLSLSEDTAKWAAARASNRTSKVAKVD